MAAATDLSGWIRLAGGDNYPDKIMAGRLTMEHAVLIDGQAGVDRVM